MNARTVDRLLAHKPSVEQVFVTGVAQEGDLLTATGDLPRLHRLFNDSALPHHDALTIAEFTRQALEVISHALLDVPLTSAFVLRRLEVEILDRAATLIGPEPAPTVVSFPTGQVRRNRRGAIAASGPVSVVIGGTPAARFGGTVAFMAPEGYHGLRNRGGRRAFGVPQGSVTPPAPASVGREVAGNVLIGPVDGPAREAVSVVVPTPHPVFFDRPTDHYPGMMIAEAARQLAVFCLAADARVPAASILTARAAVDFTAFAELDEPLRLSLTRWTDHADGAELTITAHQTHRTTTTSTFRLTSSSATS